MEEVRPNTFEQKLLSCLKYSEPIDTDTTKIYKFLEENINTMPSRDLVLMMERIRYREQRKQEELAQVPTNESSRITGRLQFREEVPQTDPETEISKIFVTRYDQKSALIYLLQLPQNKIIKRKLKDIQWLRDKLILEFPHTFVG